MASERIDIAGIRYALQGGSACVLTSQTVTAAAVALTDATTYTGGFFVWNSDTSLSFVIGLGAATTTPGAGQVTLGPGQGIPLPGAPSSYKVIAASGSPVANTQGITT